VPWVKLSDDWYDDPAITAAGTVGLAMWVVGLSWCARNLTDGHIPKSQARKLIDLEDITSDGASCRADDIASSLVELGLWTRTEAGYVVENYHDYQPTREKVLADREKDRRRKTSRPGPDTPPPNGFHAESKSDAQRNPDPPGPVPASEPDLTSSLATHAASAEPVDDDESSSSVPEETWTHYADLRFELEPDGSISKPIPWKRKTARNAAAEQRVTAERWWSLFNVSPYRLAQALVDGRAPRNVPLRREAAS
jgi:hypothetical protein